MIRKLAFLLCVLGLASTSFAGVITFEDLAHADNSTVDYGAVYSSGGFIFTNTATEEESGFPPSLATLGTLAPGFSGSTSLLNDNFWGLTVLTRDDGRAFSLNSIVLAALFPVEDVFNVEFVGRRSGGGTVSTSFTVNAAEGRQTFTFSGFDGLDSVAWAQTLSPHQFDDVNVEPVPEPAAAGLAAVGLAVLGLQMRRRRLLSR
jgi:hypothetical protein